MISKQPELLAQVGHLREAEPALRRITSAADGLQAELRRACSEVQEPYLRLRRDAVKLRNLQGTVELLRHTMQRWGRQMGPAGLLLHLGKQPLLTGRLRPAAVVARSPWPGTLLECMHRPRSTRHLLAALC